MFSNHTKKKTIALCLFIILLMTTVGFFIPPIWKFDIEDLTCEPVKGKIIAKGENEACLGKVCGKEYWFLIEREDDTFKTVYISPYQYTKYNINDIYLAIIC